LADPPETDSYPRDEPGFNPIGPRWKMPDGTWFGEGDPEPRRMFDKEAYDKKENWGTKEELMRAERVAIGLEEPYVEPDDVLVKLISRPEGYWEVTAKDEREGSKGTFFPTPGYEERVERAIRDGDEAPTWASVSPAAKGVKKPNADRVQSRSTAVGDYYATCHPGLEGRRRRRARVFAHRRAGRARGRVGGILPRRRQGGVPRKRVAAIRHSRPGGAGPRVDRFGHPGWRRGVRLCPQAPLRGTR
jgi:hypothetical protein